jgi:hypothetical protein
MIRSAAKRRDPQAMTKNILITANSVHVLDHVDRGKKLSPEIKTGDQL